MTGFHPVNFGLPRSFRSRVRSRHTINRRTDRHQPSFCNALSRSGIIKCLSVRHVPQPNSRTERPRGRGHNKFLYALFTTDKLLDSAYNTHSVIT